MRTITLELLRHGPAHNQLLSPLTQYMALCENHSAVTLHVPIEHYQFLQRINALFYKAEESSRSFQLLDTAQLLGELLTTIPGLAAELNKTDGTNERLIHLRLILSASELALLPFELIQSPNGLPGSGQHLLLQSQMPICLTREVRRTGDEPFQWPYWYRILMIAASPPDVGEIPLQAHLQALRNAITPWVKYFDKDKTDEEGRKQREKRIEEHLVVLTGASIEAIERVCASNSESPFTHIHILAHGVDRTSPYDTKSYLALHNAHDPNQVDYINGARLATALRTAFQNTNNPLARPAVVTLASCNSANVGSVVSVGASIAHDLHEAGIPIVIASQFPLSFAGSVRFVARIYEGLIWGEDPRRMLYDLRRQLYTQFPNTHDWASLTVYMSLPTDFDELLPELQILREIQSIHAAMNHADEVISLLSESLIQEGKWYEYSSPSDTSSTEPINPLSDDLNGFIGQMAPLLKEVHERIYNANRRLERLLGRWPTKKSRISGLLASIEKRQAEILFRVNSRRGTYRDFRSDEQSHELLRKSRNHYWDVFLADRSQSWAVVQYLSLTMVLYANKPKNLFWLHGNDYLSQLAGDDPNQKLAALWSMAVLLSTYDLNSKDRNRSIWAHSNLIELYLLSLIMPSVPNAPESEKIKKLALEHTDALVDIAGRLSFPVYSTRRQILRYKEWFKDIITLPDSTLFTQLTDDIFERFPQQVEDEWK